MKRIATLLMLLSIGATSIAQNTPTAPVLKTSVLSNFPFGGAARVGLEIPVGATPWALEPMIGYRYKDYNNERDLRFCPEARLSAYRYRDPNRAHDQVRQGLAFQYRMLASNEVQTVCTHYENLPSWVGSLCTAWGENNYIRRAHQFQLGYLHGWREHWGRMQVDLDVIAGVQYYKVRTQGFDPEGSLNSGFWLDFDFIPDTDAEGLLPWVVLDLKLGWPVGG